jgi:hypothetical protein
MLASWCSVADCTARSRAPYFGSSLQAVASDLTFASDSSALLKPMKFNIESQNDHILHHDHDWRGGELKEVKVFEDVACRTCVARKWVLLEMKGKFGDKESRFCVTPLSLVSFPDLTDLQPSGRSPSAHRGKRD